MKKGLYLNNINEQLFECQGYVPKKSDSRKTALFIVNFRLPFFDLTQINKYSGRAEGDCLTVAEFNYLLKNKHITYIGKV